MNVFIAVPAEKENELRTIEKTGFSYNTKEYSFSVALGEPLLAEKDGQDWLVFCHKRASEIPEELRVTEEVNGEIIIKSKEYEEIISLVASVGGFVEQGASGLDEFFLENSFVIKNGEK